MLLAVDQVTVELTNGAEDTYNGSEDLEVLVGFDGDWVTVTETPKGTEPITQTYYRAAQIASVSTTSPSASLANRPNGK